mmetsp:Transcript_29855/g.68804  ORF Transcript_29855/g.68804 Transcript_29855/m.68804 type:complete len:619 (+) Transcript_29855:72-1928(+)
MVNDVTVKNTFIEVRPSAAEPSVSFPARHRNTAPPGTILDDLRRLPPEFLEAAAAQHGTTIKLVSPPQSRRVSICEPVSEVGPPVLPGLLARDPAAPVATSGVPLSPRAAAGCASTSPRLVLQGVTPRVACGGNSVVNTPGTRRRSWAMAVPETPEAFWTRGHHAAFGATPTSPGTSPKMFYTTQRQPLNVNMAAYTQLLQGADPSAPVRLLGAASKPPESPPQPKSSLGGTPPIGPAVEIAMGHRSVQESGMQLLPPQVSQAPVTLLQPQQQCHVVSQPEQHHAAQHHHHHFQATMPTVLENSNAPLQRMTGFTAPASSTSTTAAHVAPTLAWQAATAPAESMPQTIKMKVPGDGRIETHVTSQQLTLGTAPNMYYAGAGQPHPAGMQWVSVPQTQGGSLFCHANPGAGQVFAAQAHGAPQTMAMPMGAMHDRRIDLSTLVPNGVPIAAGPAAAPAQQAGAAEVQQVPLKSANGSSELDGMTTVMLRNIPVKYNREMVLADLDQRGFAGCYDFFYLPIDFHTGNTVGYAFINFVTPAETERFRATYSGLKLSPDSPKICEVVVAKAQGKAKNVEQYRNSSVMSMDERFHPVIFDNGVRQAFPGPTRVLKPVKPRAKG